MNASQPCRQHGAVLITSLIFLIVITMLVLSSMNSNTLSEKMAGNSRDRNVAFQAAEAGLRDAMRDIHSNRFNGNTGFSAACANGLCLPQTDGTPIWVDLVLATAPDAGWATGANSGISLGYGSQTGAAALGEVAAQPRYIIEVLQSAGQFGESMVKGTGKETQPNFVYRATARGYGKSVDSSNAPISRVTLQAVYVKP